MQRARNWVISNEHTRATGKVRNTPKSNRMPTHVTGVNIATVAAMITMSFILIDRTGSSGRNSPRAVVNRCRQPTSVERAWRRFELMASTGARFEGVSHPVNGADQVCPQFSPQRLDVGVNGSSPRGIRPVPHLREQPLAGQYRAGLLRQA